MQSLPKKEPEIKISYEGQQVTVVRGDETGVFELTYNFGCGGYFGCHANSLTGLRLQQKNVKQDPKTYKYKYFNWTPNDEVRDWVYSKLIDTLNAYTMVLMGDSMNKGAPSKQQTHTYTDGVIYCTVDFVEHIIKRKHGILYASPIGTNKMHQTKADTSLCQLWIWIPPKAVERVLPGSAGVYNLSEVTHEAWAKKVQEPWGGARFDDPDKLFDHVMKKESPLFGPAVEALEQAK